ncbi:hypothetical protein OIU74_014996 [Salix koriyanagi]|uniref:Uncharacterized protein n=1 Tax=Salix koriyanagi TaxID=2511006 RepID=A0A9Q0PXS9_9ROSI|nr:hypothetical protein OIU74_014996 [Salix koriyanagi]KAJ6695999.1 hypothetical protein OIU74_014996 [Salix koriyanagi]
MQEKDEVFLTDYANTNVIDRNSNSVISVLVEKEKTDYYKMKGGLIPCFFLIKIDTSFCLIPCF